MCLLLKELNCIDCNYFANVQIPNQLDNKIHLYIV